MRLLFTVFFFMTLSKSIAQADNKIVLGHIDSLESKILQEKRKLWIYVPNNGATSIGAPIKYPVVYLLDGDAHFYSVVGMIQQLSSVNGNTICPEMIVVGIPNTDRARDLTPSHVDADPMMNDSMMFHTSGGGEAFLSFMKNELIPFIEARYPTLPFRTLIGHSFGGLTVMNALVNYKDMFNAYVAIDPSMWWDGRKLLAKVGDELRQPGYKGKTLFLGIANTMDNGMDTIKVKKDTTRSTEHIRSILALNALLQQNKTSGLNYDYRYYSNDSHGSVPLITTYDALRFIFSAYDLRLTMEDYSKFSKATIAKIENHYKQVSNNFGFAVHAPEMLVNQMGYVAMSQKKWKKRNTCLK